MNIVVSGVEIFVIVLGTSIIAQLIRTERLLICFAWIGVSLLFLIMLSAFILGASILVGVLNIIFEKVILHIF